MLSRCIEEDGGLDGDVTSFSIIPPDARGRFSINVRGSGTIAGLNPIANAIDVFGDLSIELIHKDGDVVQCGNIAILEGQLRTILIAERSMLNILGYASGVATRTRSFVEAIVGTNCKVCDTRKTTPGLRLLDKYAVACGGGTSHRFGLHDAALYKDNHLAGLDDVSRQLGVAITEVKKNQDLKFVEVEVDSLEQLETVLLLNVDIILLDNMPTDLLRQAVLLRDESASSPRLEASGGVNLNTIREIAETGVDRVSVGGLTHQASWLDIGLDIIDG